MGIMPARRFGAVALGLLAVGMAIATPASGHFSSTEYSYPSSCSGAIDPVSLVLYGPNATGARSQALVQRETGWGGDDSTDQYTGSHGYCLSMGRESYDNCALCNRKHVRFNQTYHADTLGRLTTVATPHEERVTTCGHVTFSYISARNAIAFAMNPPFSFVYHYDGNDAALRQCNGSTVASDGYSIWVNIN